MQSSYWNTRVLDDDKRILKYEEKSKTNMLRLNPEEYLLSRRHARRKWRKSEVREAVEHRLENYIKDERTMVQKKGARQSVEAVLHIRLQGRGQE